MKKLRMMIPAMLSLLISTQTMAIDFDTPVTFNQGATITGGVAGVTDGSNATAGKVGEYVEDVLDAIVQQATPVLDTYYDSGVSITLTAGDWIIYTKATGDIQQSDAGANAYSLIGVLRDSVDTNIDGGLIVNSGGDYRVGQTGAGTTHFTTRVSISTTTTYKISFVMGDADNSPAGTFTTLNMRASVPTSTIAGATKLSAVRIR